MEKLAYTLGVPDVDDYSAVFENDPTGTDSIAPDLIRQELSSILESRHFRHSKRSRQFLQFVVEQKINGQEDLLKERLIGAEVFGRDVDYSTGDDPVVRVQAGEVRRRLELYQADIHGGQLVSIEIPVGSYAPVFHLRASDAAPASTLPLDHLSDEHVPAGETLPKETPILPGLEQAPAAYPHIAVAHFWQAQPKRRLWPVVCGICACLLLAALGTGYGIYRANSPGAWIDAFWRPAKEFDKPVLICLGKPIFYQPSSAIYDKYAGQHPGAFATPMERRNRVLPLDPNELIRWGDMNVIDNSGPAVGGVRAAMNISALFGHRGIPFAVRFGNDATFTDLRESPAVIIGALNNKWMTQMSSELPFAMQAIGGSLFIHEAGPKGRTWGNLSTPEGWRDYCLITRQLKGPTGEFTVKVEGISDGGTEAGTELISNPQYLSSAFQNLPKGWEKKNLQLVVETDIIGDKPGPPKVVAYDVW